MKKNMRKNTTVITSILLLLLGVSFLLLENIFYQHIDIDGILQESLFMPLGFLSIFIGLSLLLFAAIKRLIHQKDNV